MEKPRVRSSASRESGQVTVLILGLALVCIAVAGVAVDGTRAFLYRRTLQNAADASALAGAAEIDRGKYYSTGGKAIALEHERALRAAERWLAARGLPIAASIHAGSEDVRVALRGEVATTFLNLIGVGELPVAVEAVAEPIPGSP
jgi:Putative Flp pilus-assembly TadE/G-like